MFKRKEVEEMRDTVYYKDGDEITFGSVQNALAAQASEARLPMAFRMDHIKEGALMGDTTPCLVVFHPEHPTDYYNMRKHQEEQFYYQLCMEIFDQVLS